MMPNVDIEAMAKMIFELSPEDRAKVTEELGMKDGPERPTRSRQAASDDPPTSYRVRRVPLF